MMVSLVKEGFGALLGCTVPPRWDHRPVLSHRVTQAGETLPMVSSCGIAAPLTPQRSPRGENGPDRPGNLQGAAGSGRGGQRVRVLWSPPPAAFRGAAGIAAAAGSCQVCQREENKGEKANSPRVGRFWAREGGVDPVE